jgi:uncharacterized OsmC-like protein
MELNVTYLGNVQFEAEARGHKIVCDQPFDNHGDDEGMTPPELLLASLATCAGFYAVQYLKARNLSSDGLKVKVSSGKAKEPARMDGFVIDVEVPGLEDPQHIEGVRRSADKCLIKNTLKVPPSIEVRINGAVPAAV